MPAPKAHVFDAKKDGSQSDIAVRPTAARPPQIPQLTGLRFIAAFFVVLYHYGQFTIQYPPWLNYAASVGNIGVSLFFVLSGFILTYNYLHQFENGPIGFTSFIKARFFRIYPMHFVMLAVFTVWYLARLGSTEYTNVVAFLLHLLAIQSLFPSNAVIHTLNDPSWSISAELVFYTTLPFFIRFVLRGKQTESSLMKLIASLYALELTLTIVHYALTHSVFAPGLADAGSPLTQGVGPNMAYFSPLIRIMEFFIGCGFAKLLLVQLDQRSDKQGGQFTAKKAPLMRIIPVAIAIIAMPGLLILFGRPVITPDAFYMYTLLFGLMIFFIAKDGGFITRILKHPYLVLLGEASFSLYMIHFFPLILLRTMYRDTMPAVIIPLLVMLLTVAASVICYKYIENPSRLFLNNRFR